MVIASFMTPWAAWTAVQSLFSSFLWFILGYALAKLGIMKTVMLFLVFLALRWTWENWHLFNKLNTLLAGSEG